MTTEPVLSVDAMGGDEAPAVVIDGLAHFCERRSGIRFLLHGDEGKVRPLLDAAPEVAARCELKHTESAIAMDAKPSAALRNARGTSMMNAIEAVKSKEAAAAVSAGNTGALMAIAMLSLRKMKGVHRPGMTAMWPTVKGNSVILDVGANLDADAPQLVTFAVMGEAFARAVLGKPKPTVGLLNIGTEDVKGHDAIKTAGATLGSADLGIDYRGFVEGDDISAGAVDVVVTDGFTGNVAIKAAEGTGRMMVSFLREAFAASSTAKLGGLLARSGLGKLREKLNPANSNGAVLLGLNGLVVKSHGGTTAEGYSVALARAADLAESDYFEEVAASLAKAGASPTSEHAA